MAVTGMNHFTVLTDDVDASVAFYTNIMDLRAGPRPTLGFAGAWMYDQHTPIVHIVGGRTREQLRPGVIDHMAFSAQGLEPMLKRLEAAGIHYAARRQVESQVWQVFFFDPNGARIELDFPADEAGPPGLA